MRPILLMILVSGCSQPNVKTCTVKSNNSKHVMTCPDGTSTEWIDSTTKEPPNVLVITSNILAGSECAYGGTKLEAGIDTNTNGALDVEEITTTQYVCDGDIAENTGGILYGSIIIKNSADVALLSGYTSVTGAITIVPTGAMSITLPSLQSVDRLSVNSGVNDLQMKALNSIGNYISIKLTQIITLEQFGDTSLSAGYIEILDNTQLHQCKIDEFMIRTQTNSNLILGNADGC